MANIHVFHCFIVLYYIVTLGLYQDEARVQKVTKRLHTLEEVNINVKLLTEMLSHYNKDSSTDSDKEIIKVCVCALTHTNDMVNLNEFNFNKEG